MFEEDDITNVDYQRLDNVRYNGKFGQTIYYCFETCDFTGHTFRRGAGSTKAEALADMLTQKIF